MEQVGMFEAKTRFSELVERVNQTGLAITVTNRGKPVAELTPVRHSPEKKTTREEVFARVAELWKEEPSVAEGEIQKMIEEGRDRCLDV